MLEMWVNIADQLTHYQDEVADEAFLSTASERLGVSKRVLRSVLHAARAVNAITSEIATRRLKDKVCLEKGLVDKIRDVDEL